MLGNWALSELPLSGTKAASSGVSVALSGSAQTLSSGAMSVSGAAAALGSAAALATGSFVAAVTLALGGQAEAASQGQLAAAITAQLVGSQETLFQGAVTPSSAIEIQLSGQSESLYSGVFAASGSLAMTGISASYSQGTLTPSSVVEIQLSGQQQSFSQGDVAVNPRFVDVQPHGSPDYSYTGITFSRQRDDDDAVKKPEAKPSAREAYRQIVAADDLPKIGVVLEKSNGLAERFLTSSGRRKHVLLRADMGEAIPAAAINWKALERDAEASAQLLAMWDLQQEKLKAEQIFMDDEAVILDELF